MSNFLTEILQHKKSEIAARVKEKPLQELLQNLQKLEEDQIWQNWFKNCDFFAALQNRKKLQQIGLICEIKRGSPSAGLIRQDFDAAKIAEIYENSGAACLSVLTDERYFLGGSQFLIAARKASNLPILRKDFFVDAYQIYEAKLLGANCILLIVAMLPDEKLQELEEIALNLGLSVLVEIHDEAELLRTKSLKSCLIGVNNRNLKTLKTDIQTSFRIAEFLANNPNFRQNNQILLVAESGIKTAGEIAALQKNGINCFLIGEHFMRQKDIGEAVRKMF